MGSTLSANNKDGTPGKCGKNSLEDMRGLEQKTARTYITISLMGNGGSIRHQEMASTLQKVQRMQCPLRDGTVSWKWTRTP